MHRDDTVDRREFVKRSAGAGLGIAMAGRFPTPAILRDRAPSERVVIAVVGLNGRGTVHAQNWARSTRTEIAYLCDVDSTVLAKAQAGLSSGITLARAPRGIGDFRRALEDKSVDAVSIATPDFWHTPAAILALQAGKHVYVEKPASHDGREIEMLAAAQAKYGRLVQIGNQQRSAPRSIEAIELIRAGTIGKPYLARAWYANTRGTIGKGKPAPVPSNLDWELWQGPVPRTAYRDNVVHYNWHWFRQWGTGEICNNGTHEIDVARWALGVDRPARVSSTGGRHHFADDWEFPDVQEVVYSFEGGRTITWSGQSCNGVQTFNRGRGTHVIGTDGSIVLDRDGYVLYDAKGKVVREEKEAAIANGLDFAGNDAHTAAHMENFADAVRSGAALRSPVAEIAKSIALCHLGNIAQFTGRDVMVDARTGRPTDAAVAKAHWGREYAKGWAPTV